MLKIRENAAGIDIGAKKVFVYVEAQDVKSFYTFTEDFELLAQYLLKHKVQTVAMEATGVYWAILYDILEEAKSLIELHSGSSELKQHWFQRSKGRSWEYEF